MDNIKEIEARRATAQKVKIIEKVPDKHFFQERERLVSSRNQTHNPYNPMSHGIPSPCVKVRCPNCGNEQYTFVSNLKEAVSKCNSCGVVFRD